MDSNELKEPGTYVLIYQNKVASCIYKKQDIQWECSNIPNMVCLQHIVYWEWYTELAIGRTWLSKCFSMKDFVETAYILD